MRTCRTYDTVGSYFLTENMPANRELNIKYFVLDSLSLPLTTPRDAFTKTMNKVRDRI
jgi:hypothetical protein